MDIALKFSRVYHPQTDGQTKVVNHSLENLLRCLVGGCLTTWDTVLPVAKFAYNSSVNRSTGLNPFEKVNGYKARKPIDLPFPIGDRPSTSAESFA